MDLRYGLNLEGSADEDRSWAQIVTNATEAPSADLPQIAAAGMYATVPVITMSTYLSWLHAQVQAQGVQFIKRNLQSLNDLEGEADLVVLATGLRGAELTGDDQSVYPIRGQVIRLANSRAWLTGCATTSIRTEFPTSFRAELTSSLAEPT